jgi:hypothetical protein
MMENEKEQVNEDNLILDVAKELQKKKSMRAIAGAYYLWK